MEKKNIDWSSIGFSYMPTDYRYVSNFKDGKWDEGTLSTDPNIVLNECAGVLQYSQSVFEGLKAYTTEDGHIVTFRPDLNAERLSNSAKRLEMPPISTEQFLDAIDQVLGRIIDVQDRTAQAILGNAENMVNLARARSEGEQPYVPRPSDSSWQEGYQ